MSNEFQIGLFNFKEPTIPTEISRKNPLQIGNLQHQHFDFGLQTVEDRTNPEKRKTLRNYYRHFKSDLTKNKSELKGPGDDLWTMKTKRTDDDKSRGARSEIIQQTGKNLSYFSAIHATEVFLYKSLERAIHKIDRLFQGTVPTINVHFTAPAFDNPEEPSSQLYRDYLRQIVKRLSGITPINRVTFNVGKDRFLYEPYAIWQYYATVEEAVSSRVDAAGKTFLVFDMGGSTTDLALVKMHKTAGKIRLYPFCRSLERAGEFLDRFILKRLLNLERLPVASSKTNHILEEIERAKIDICSGVIDEYELSIDDQKHPLTRSFIEDTLKESWEHRTSKTSGLGPFLRNFLTKAKRESKLGDFDQIESVFLAGGSTGLPGLEELIQEDILKAGFNRIEKEAFVVPQKTTSNGKTLPRSCLAALGQAAEMAETDYRELEENAPSLVLDRAEHVYMQARDEKGKLYAFPRKNQQSSLGQETYLFGINELRENVKERFDEINGPLPYKHYSIAEDEEIPSEMKLYFRNNLESTYHEHPHLEIESQINDKRLGDASSLLHNKPKSITFSCHAEKKDEELRISPFFRVTPHVPSRKPIRFDGKAEPYKVHVSLKPESVMDKTAPPSDQAVHVCMDLGMNNSVIALYAPGRTLPEHDPELEVFNLFTNTTSMELNNQNASSQNGAEEPTTMPMQQSNGSMKQKQDEHKATAPEQPEPIPFLPEEPQFISPLHWTHGFADWIKTVATPNSTSNSTDMETVVQAIEELRKSLAPIHQIAHTLEESHKANRPLPRNWEDEIQEEITSDNSALSLHASEDTSYEAFEQFIRSKNTYFYSDSVLEQIWTRCKSDVGQLIVLAGPPGSGKTTLVRLIAEFFNRDIDAKAFPNGWEDYYLLQPVSPAWFSPASLLGAVNPLHGRFQATTFLRFLMKAQIHYREFTYDEEPSRLFFACLDEFNIAQPEQYLADLLSKLEAPPNSNARKIVLFEGSRSDGEDAIEVELTPNFKLFATLNTDVSTKLLSPKVLDRSFFLRLTPTPSEIDKAARKFCKQYETDTPGILAFHKAFGPYFGELYKLSSLSNTPIAFRVLNQVYAFVAHHPCIKDASNNQRLEQLLEEVICSFFLPKLPGAHAVSNTEYVSMLKEKCSTLKKLPKVKHILNQVLSGFPGQAVL